MPKEFISDAVKQEAEVIERIKKGVTWAINNGGFAALTIAVLMLATSMALAQDGDGDNCTADDWNEGVVQASSTFEADIAGVIETADPTDFPSFVSEAHAIVVAYANALDQLLVACGVRSEDDADLGWSDTGQEMIGPVNIPSGTYRANVVTDDFFIAKVQALSGNCGEGPRMSPYLFSLSAGDAAGNGADALFVSEGCNAVITTELVSGRWELTLTPIG